MSKKIIIIGGGAAGFFAAIRSAELNPEASITILEAGKEVLSKVKISGGGRCNLTHACFIPKELAKFYPRGERELIGPFHRFCSGDTVEWFEKRGVPTKIEDDGRMFPVSDSSQSVIDCLVGQVRKYGVNVVLHHRVHQLIPPSETQKRWQIHTKNQLFEADAVLVATGSSPAMWQLIEQLGHTIVEPVPSLFTFNIPDKRIRELPGLSMPNTSLSISGTKLQANGPLLITHWGLSGPAILRLSAWGARELAQRKYQFTLQVNWLGQNPTLVREKLEAFRQDFAKKLVLAQAQFGMPMRLWRSLAFNIGISESLRWAALSNKLIQQLCDELTQARFEVNGKSTFKEEFVTAGGVDLREVNFKTFQSKLFPSLFFAGEVLNIDAITGGFNFQAAWTGGWIAGEAIAERLNYE
ncbi:MAG TPA: NAD(P)/FAD-dependent oxidoreductase [Saprospiraceae bacterium]|nr:NAD(P)/FAD-dependent oxidoreductase [Saprospiraceae bacterium]HMQ83053.1 NAD(P)/FAD-dependent oxidoreductase [Saprospiraceae bacterium]